MGQFEVEEFDSLPGERSSAPEDAQHWLSVYRELIEFCELMLSRPELSLEAGHLQRRIGHYRRRLVHWEEELDGARQGNQPRLDDPWPH
jgi:hypothetical protein